MWETFSIMGTAYVLLIGTLVAIGLLADHIRERWALGRAIRAVRKSRPYRPRHKPSDYYLTDRQIFCICRSLSVEAFESGRWFDYKEMIISKGLFWKLMDATQHKGLTYTQWRALLTDAERDFLYWFVFEIEPPHGLDKQHLFETTGQYKIRYTGIVGAEINTVSVWADWLTRLKKARRVGIE